MKGLERGEINTVVLPLRVAGLKRGGRKESMVGEYGGEHLREAQVS